MRPVYIGNEIETGLPASSRVTRRYEKVKRKSVLTRSRAGVTRELTITNLWRISQCEWIEVNGNSGTLGGVCWLFLRRRRSAVPNESVNRVKSLRLAFCTCANSTGILVECHEVAESCHEQNSPRRCFESSLRVPRTCNEPCRYAYASHAMQLLWLSR